MGGNPKTTEFLKECLADAFIKLLELKPIGKITVPEITQTACVGRTTYFRNFKTKNEMLTFKIVLLWERWAAEHCLSEHRVFSVSNASDFFYFNYSIRHLLNLIYARGLQVSIYDAFFCIMMPPDVENAVECYKNRFYSSGLFGLLDEWVRRGFQESPAEMSRLIKEIW